MSKLLVGAVAASALTSAVTVQAQSSVTLYGLLSVGPAYVSNEGGHSVVASLSDEIQPSRWGFKGVEDLGGGMKAIFTLENGFSLNTGALLQGGREFGRQAFMGLDSAQYGTLTLGRQYDTNFDYFVAYEAPIFAGVATHVGDNDQLFGSTRYQNAIKYQTPTAYGFTAAGFLAMSNSSDFSDNKTMTLSGRYVNGPFSAALGYLVSDRPNSADNPNGAASTDYPGPPPSFFRTSMVTPGVGVDKQTVYAAGGGYAYAYGRINADATSVEFHYLDHTSLHLYNLDFNATYRPSAPLLLGAGYTYTAGSYSGLNYKPHYHQAQAAIIYSLSKRTDLDLFAIWQRAAGDAKIADIFTLPASGSRTQLMINAGIRTRF